MLNIIIFGPPGAGKGTQAEFIKKKYNLAHISTGDLLRAEVKNGSALGLEAKSVMEAGKLVSDNLIVQIMEKFISENSTKFAGFLFDGFPRNLAQCDILEGMFAKLNTKLTAVVALNVPSEELIARLLKRAEIEGRADDNLETIKSRLQEYENKTFPVIGFYEKSGKVISINGAGSIDEIAATITAEIDKLK